jgi:hypothetical protein
MWWCGSDIPPTVVRQYSDSAPTVRQSDSPTVVRQSDSVRQWQHTFTVILVRQSTTVVRQWSDRGPTVRKSDSLTELRQCPTELRQCPTAPTVLTARAQFAARQSGVNRGSIATQDPLAPSPKEMIAFCCIHRLCFVNFMISCMFTHDITPV